MIKLSYIKNYGNLLLKESRNLNIPVFYHENRPIYLFGSKTFAIKKTILVETKRLIYISD